MAKTKPNTITIVPCQDFNRRTCIEVLRENGFVSYIPLDIDTGLEVRQLADVTFDDRYQPIKEYPPIRACQLYAGYSRTIGATDEAMRYLLKAGVPLTEEDIIMATAKRKTEDTTPKPKAKGKKKSKTETASPAKKTKVAKPTGKQKVLNPESIGGICCDLLLKGKSTEEILAAVLKKFPDASTSASSIAWYRNKLKKEGKLK